MAEFGRTQEQDDMWEDLNEIRQQYESEGCLLTPTEGMADTTDPDDLEDMQDTYDDLLADYADAHSDNDTFG